LLAEQGIRVTLASDKRSLEAALESNDIRLIVLDVMLPDGSGPNICRDKRAENSHVPIILLTALKEGVDRRIGQRASSIPRGVPFRFSRRD
jgi:two-component system, OmpR family, response regulator